MINRRRPIVVICSVIIGALVALSAQPAGAQPPEAFEFHRAGRFVIDCGGFLLYEDITIDVEGKIYFDQDGQPLRKDVLFSVEGVITTPDGTQIRDRGHFRDRDELVDGGWRRTGMIFNITVPGHGSVAQDTGFLSFHPDGTVVMHGPHEVFDAGSVEALLCPLFE